MDLNNTLYVVDRLEWRKWLADNHNCRDEIWLIYYKKHTGKPRIPYNDAVEEALCYGWIDSIVKRIDDDCFCQKFTPRTNTRKWSPSNIKRINKLIKQGKMTDTGMAKIDESVLKTGVGEDVTPPAIPTLEEMGMPQWIEDALKAEAAVWEFFNTLAPSYKRKYIFWITQAKREETRQRRLKEAVSLLAKKKKLGLK